MQALNNFQTYHFDFEEVCPTDEEIKSFLKFNDTDEKHPINQFLKEIFPEISSNKNISGGYIIRKADSIHIKEGIIEIGNTKLNTGSQICGYMKEASFVALFLCTAGETFTRLTKKFNATGDLLEAYLIDSIGSLTVEKAMDKIHEDLEKKMDEKEFKISNRYSPGYCNWALTGQKLLFELIDKNPVHISLSDSCLMTPIKSVSGIIGIGKDIKKRPYACQICQNTLCIYRKIIKK